MNEKTKKELKKLRNDVRDLQLSYWTDNELTCPIAELGEIVDRIDKILAEGT